MEIALYFRSMAAIRNIIFDLGGVVMNIDFKKTAAAFAALGFTDFTHYMTQFHITPFFEDYETGKIDDATFINGIRQIARQEIGDNEIIDAWNALLLDFPPERIALLENLKKHFRIFLLSNTNALHHAAFQERLFALTGKRLENIFEKTYFSHTEHLRKPGADIYHLVLTQNMLVPAETLFIDDTAANFTGAQQCGIHTFHLVPPLTINTIPLFQNL